MNNIDEQLKDHVGDFILIFFKDGGAMSFFRTINVVVDNDIKDAYCIKRSR